MTDERPRIIKGCRIHKITVGGKTFDFGPDGMECKINAPLDTDRTKDVQSTSHTGWTTGKQT
jgi:hypothetical protein